MTLYIYGYCLLQPLHEYGSISWHSELLQALVYIVRSTLSFIIFNITHKVVQCNLKSLLNYRQSIAYINTPWTVKRCHFVFDYNSGIFWSIFLYFLHQWKQVGILYKHVDKIYHFTLNVSPHYLVKLDCFFHFCNGTKIGLHVMYICNFVSSICWQIRFCENLQFGASLHHLPEILTVLFTLYQSRCLVTFFIGWKSKWQVTSKVICEVCCITVIIMNH